ncbi:hypothetical protein [Rhodoferax ferrireducens]|nr:hypothetical protein [Rhodoferax ferrireducens]
MKLINSPVRSSSLAYWFSPKRGQSMAAAKKIVHKQERAQLRQLARKDLLVNHLVDLAEKVEQDRLDREAAFVNLMRKAMAKKHPGQPAPKARSEVSTGVRYEVRVSTSEDRKFAVLASCAID